MQQIGTCSAIGGVALVAALSASADEPALPQSFAGYHFINALVIDDPDNPLFGFHHFYANDIAMPAFKSGEPYPAGSTFLGLVYKVSSDGGLINEGGGAAYTMMIKVPELTETGGWQFTQFEPDGTLIELDAKSACFQCHPTGRD